MKHLLLIFLSGYFISVSAQMPDLNFKFKKLDGHVYILDSGERIFTPGVHFLPQDGMPCIVPETVTLGNIPNAWNGKRILFNDKIPNPYNDGKGQHFEYRLFRKPREGSSKE